MKNLLSFIVLTNCLQGSLEAADQYPDLYSARGETSFVKYQDPLYSSNSNVQCTVQHDLKFEILPGTQQFRLNYVIKSYNNSNIVCEHGLPRSAVIEGNFAISRKGSSDHYPYFDIELLATKEQFGLRPMETLLLGRTLGGVRIYPDFVTEGEHTGYGEFALFGGLFPRGIKIGPLSQDPEIRRENFSFESVVLKK